MKWKYITLLFITIISLLYFYFQDQKNHNTEFNSDIFSVKDTSSIDQIFFADKKGNTIHLFRDKKRWFVTGKHLEKSYPKYKARYDAINILLQTIADVKIQKTVSKNALNNIVNNLATSGVKVEIYTVNDSILPAITYTIGNSSKDHLGTYFYLKNDDAPYVCHLPFFNGFLSPRYGIQGGIVDIKKWRRNVIIDAKLSEITLLSLKHLDRNNKSFTLRKSNDGFELLDFNGNKIKYNGDKIIDYLNRFKSISCESYKDEVDKKLIPLHVLVVNNDTLETYQFIDNNIKENDPNVKRMYARINNGELMLIQNYVFNNLLITIDELVK